MFISPDLVVAIYRTQISYACHHSVFQCDQKIVPPEKRSRPLKDTLVSH